MSASPETIAAGLLSYLQARIPVAFDQTGIAVFGRRLKFWSDVSEKTALFVRHMGDLDVWEGRGLHRKLLRFEVWLYAKTPSPDDTPATDINAAVQLFRIAMEPDGDEENTLGGIVYTARIEGDSEYAPGDIDGQSKAIMSVHIDPGP